GTWVAKVFQGEGSDALLKEARGRFRRVRFCKPAASREESREVYWLGEGHRGAPGARGYRGYNRTDHQTDTMPSNGGEDDEVNEMAKNLVLWLIIAAVLLSIFQNFRGGPTPETITYTNFVDEIQAGQIRSVLIDGVTIEGERHTGTRFRTIRPDVYDSGLMSDLLNNNVNVEGREPDRASFW